MSVPRFYCDAPLAPGLVQLSADEAKHALGSLRLRDGADVLLFDGRGRVAHGRLAPAPETRGQRKPRERVAWARLEHVLQAPPPTRTLELLVAACKGPRLAWMIEKLTELGTTGITLTPFERSVAGPGAGQLAKLVRIAVEAAKQCGRVWLPEVRIAASLADALQHGGGGALLVADPDEAAPSLASWLHAHAPATPRLRAVVGPEGGLTDTELDRLREAGGQVVRLNENILRIETAAVCVAANWAARSGGAAV